jgi:hypothetical protein
MKRCLLMLALFSAQLSTAHAQEGRGFGELRLSAFPGAEGDTWQLVERFRPTLSMDIDERVKLVATIEAALHQGRDVNKELQESQLGLLLTAAGCEFPQQNNSVLRIDSAADYLAVDRLYFDFYLDFADIRVGRQALNWGSAQFFNPTDPFPQVLLAEPWRPRQGVNAVRVNVPFGERHDATAVVAGNDAFTTLRAAAKLRFNWLETDWALVAAYRGDRDTGLVGIDIRGTLELGYWLEAAYLLGSNPHEELSVGIDYSFPILERAVLFAQYYRNGAGSTRPASSLPSFGGGFFCSGNAAVLPVGHHGGVEEHRVWRAAAARGVLGALARAPLAREVLDRPDLSVLSLVEAARDLGHALVGHVQKVPVRLEAAARTVALRRRAFVPHALQALADHLLFRAPARAFVLGAAARTDAIAEPSVGVAPLAVVLGHLVCARFAFYPALQRR